MEDIEANSKGLPASVCADGKFDTRYLYPGTGAIPIGAGEDVHGRYMDYLLSSVLGSWGCTIRHLRVRPSSFKLLSYVNADGERIGSWSVEGMPCELSGNTDFGNFLRAVYDLRLRYYLLDGEDLSFPVCIGVCGADWLHDHK